MKKREVYPLSFLSVDHFAVIGNGRNAARACGGKPGRRAGKGNDILQLRIGQGFGRLSRLHQFPHGTAAKNIARTRRVLHGNAA